MEFTEQEKEMIAHALHVMIEMMEDEGDEEWQMWVDLSDKVGKILK